MKLKLIFIILLLVIISENSCKDNSVGPGAITPGRRDYTWTRDTLRADEAGFQFLSGIWGSSPSDVWIIGDAATYVNKVWHFDGSKWKNYLLDKFATPIQIWGISSDEIWMVTTRSDIWRYNGLKWYVDTTIVPDGYHRILFEDIFGYKNNIYAVGIAEKSSGDFIGIVVHYDGNKWKILNTAKIEEYFLSILFLENQDILITGLDYLHPIDSPRLYKLKDSTITLIKKGSSTDFHLGILNNKMYVNSDRKVYEYDNGTLNEVIDLTSTDYAGSIWGRTTKDFFSANNGWNLGHYNGGDMVNIYHTEGYILDAQIFAKDVFFICNTLDNVNYVLHGKLK